MSEILPEGLLVDLSNLIGQYYTRVINALPANGGVINRRYLREKCCFMIVLRVYCVRMGIIPLNFEIIQFIEDLMY
jgi:hypothetical protein